jgi:hypothetical protein
LAGPSNADLAEAGQGAVLSLTKATAALLTYAPESRDVEHLEPKVGLSAMVTALIALADIASREFVEIDRPPIESNCPNKLRGAEHDVSEYS